MGTKASRQRKQVALLDANAGHLASKGWACVHHPRGRTPKDGIAPLTQTRLLAFRQGQQRLREGRAPEALTWFLKVIDRRGVQNSPESHLQAGVIYLQYIKDPVEAYHHFRKYLELQPNSRESVLVRQQLDAAKRRYEQLKDEITAEERRLSSLKSEMVGLAGRLEAAEGRLEKAEDGLRATQKDLAEEE